MKPRQWYSRFGFSLPASPGKSVVALFRALLGRDPEPSAIRAYGGLGSVEAIARSIASSVEFRQRHSSPFWHYRARFDPVALMHKYAAPQPKPRADLIVNFLDVAIAPKFLPAILGSMPREVQPMPLPANWHADIAEFGAVLRAIDLSKGSFTMAELGCGWGCWMVNSCVPAKRHGRSVHAIGVEGDPGHVAFAREAAQLNGLTPDEVTLHHAIASGTDGYALFPLQDKAGHSWGLQAVFDATAEQRERAAREKTHTELRSMSLASVAGDRRLDLLHIDIQGAEVDVVRSGLDFISSKVAYMVIGTHSRQIEGRLMDLLQGRGWSLDIERPAILALDREQPYVEVDGVQGWRNLALT
ncbi:FkbM family methyltransferase [Ramlibacter henchirensis]|nr:FkbM family methyltransferase [Ramlibacter henchirensis]